MLGLVIGVGNQGPAHVQALQKAGVDVAVCDVNPKRLPSGIKGFTNLEDALKYRPDLCVVSSPTGTHAPICAALLEAGVKIILVEKPLAASPDAANEIVNRSVAAGAQVFTGFHLAWVVEPALPAIALFGREATINATWRRRDGRPPLIQAPEGLVYPGGPLEVDLGSHLFHLLSLLGKPVTRLTARARGWTPAGWDEIDVFTPVGNVSLAYRCSTVEREELAIEVLDQSQYLRIKLPTERTERAPSPEGRLDLGSFAIAGPTSICLPTPEEAFALQARQLVYVAMGGPRGRLTPASEAARVVNVCDAVARSLATGGEVLV
ncbi:MAG TPA: Gfo/Idh/MocA family oxidoreductase [Solirubrobacteraceae bacterium]|nr:Gfo/Idh/MocA family oxidoreductase [Solirubrobacteraceae bacterium]